MFWKKVRLASVKGKKPKGPTESKKEAVGGKENVVKSQSKQKGTKDVTQRKEDTNKNSEKEEEGTVENDQGDIRDMGGR